MLSKLKEALDRTITEEQARHRAFNERAANARNSAQSGPADPDPSVFEAAFKLDDDTDGPSGSSTPKLVPVTDESSSGKKSSAAGHKGDGATSASANPPEHPTTAPSTPSTLSPHVEARLKRLDRLELSYRELLRSYRLAHSRAVAADRFDRILRENTPLDSIKNPDGFESYITELNEKNTKVVEELRRVLADNDDYKKKCEKSDKELAALKDELVTLKAAAEANRIANQPDKTEDGKIRDDGDQGEDMFSYDDEIAILRSELVSKDEQIVKLTSETNERKEALAKAESLLKVADSSKDEEKEARQIKELLDLQARFEELKASNKEIKITLEKACEENRSRDETIDNLNQELSKYRQANVGIPEDSKSSPAVSTPPDLSATSQELDWERWTTKKGKKNRKSDASQGPANTTPSKTSQRPQQPALRVLEIEILRADISRLKEDIAEKDLQLEDLSKQKKSQGEFILEIAAKNSEIEKLSKRMKSQDLLEEEVGVTRESLIETGHSLMEAKARVEKLENENKALEARKSELEKELERVGSNSKVQAEYDTMKSKFDDLKAENHTLKSELGASQKIAQDRFKDLAQQKEINIKAQAQIKSLNHDLAAAKITQEEVTSKTNELRTLEKRVKELVNDNKRLQRLLSDRESELKLSNDRLAADKTARTKMEDEKRTLDRNVRRLQSENNEKSVKAEKLRSELDAALSRSSALQSKSAALIKNLEDEIGKLTRLNTIVKEEADSKARLLESAQGMMASMRHQVTELTMQRKEAQDQAESLEEELADAQKHLAERTREGENMRRRLAEMTESTDAQVREAKSKMEAAIEERDRIEDESSTLARRRSREAEELRNKVRELEREVRALSDVKEDLEGREREWRQRREELEQIEEKANAETEEMRSTISSLRSAVDASEQQVSDTEKQKADLKKLLEEARSRYERVNKELKNVQSRLNLGSVSNVASSGRSSTDSTRSGVSGSLARGSYGISDAAYLKTVFLQFLQVRDDKVRLQLIPVLGKLLGFDKQEQQQGIDAILHPQKSGKYS
ncbi:hypothetical protein GQX73_g9343 [Xylaria multiplex]|uniref:GRIP domain-containing protein n=1 Tax=Xylaria multiplex TaxID=323545 RepID=A0A7C8MMN7_9PEZI|nr:hypothetical protein GQX73_g9343 [Xylaria multiplex]